MSEIRWNISELKFLRKYLWPLLILIFKGFSASEEKLSVLRLLFEEMTQYQIYYLQDLFSLSLLVC